MGILIERFEKAIEGLHVEGETQNIMVAISKEEHDEIVSALHSKNFIWNAAIQLILKLRI